MKPKFKHDCDGCQFLGHHFGHDVYFCGKAAPFPTFVARWGDDPPDYGSSCDVVLRDQFRMEHRIGGETDGQKWVMPFPEYVFSGKCSGSTRAIFMALALSGLDALTKKGAPGERVPAGSTA